MGNGVTEVRNKRPVIPSLPTSDHLSTELRRAGYTESANIIRRLVVEHDVLKFSYAKMRQLAGPVVYVWTRRDGIPLYVGCSKYGGHRFFNPRHHRLALRDGDRLDVYPMDNEERARGVERDLIRALRPKFNNAGVGAVDDPLPPSLVTQEPRLLAPHYERHIRLLSDMEYARAEGSPS